MIDVLVIGMAVVVVALVVLSRRRTAVGQRSRRADVLTALAPVVGGSISDEQVLTGRYRGHGIRVCLRTADPAPPGLSVGSESYLVEAVDLRLDEVHGALPWYVWRSPSLTGGTWQWHFARPDGSEFVPFLGRFSRLVGLPQVDPGLPDRLRAAGIADAFDRLGPPTKDSLPRIRFTPDLRPFMADRLRAAHDLPPAAHQPPADLGACLELELERQDGADPTPERFRAVLDAAVAIAEVNARANPAPTPA